MRCAVQSEHLARALAHGHANADNELICGAHSTAELAEVPSASGNTLETVLDSYAHFAG